jgi:hypothetical protein
MSGLDGKEDTSVVPDENGKSTGHQEHMAGALEHSPGNSDHLPATLEGLVGNPERLSRSPERPPAAIESGLPHNLE